MSSSARSACSRRCSRARSSAGSTSPRRWRRAATAAQGARGRRDRRGRASTGSRSSAPSRSCVVGAVALAQVDGLRFAYVAGTPVLDGVSLDDRRRRARRAARAIGLRQVDAAARARRARAALPRRRLRRPRDRRRPRHARVAAGGARRSRRLRLPGPRGPGRDEPGRERGRVRPREPRRRPGRDLAARRRGARAGRRGAPRRATGRRALGGRAATRVPRLGARASAAAAAARRADVAARPRGGRGVLRPGRAPAVRGARLRAATGTPARARRPRALHGRGPHRARCAARRGPRLARRTPAPLSAARADVVCSLRDVSFAYGDRRCSTVSRSRFAAARSSRSPARTASGRRRWRRSPPACSSPTPARSQHDRASFLTQDPGRHLVTERVVDEVALGSDEHRAREALASSGSRSTPAATRATSRWRARAAGARCRLLGELGDELMRDRERELVLARLRIVAIEGVAKF